MKRDKTGMNMLLTEEYPLKPFYTKGLQSYEHLNTPLDHNIGHRSELFLLESEKGCPVYFP